MGIWPQEAVDKIQQYMATYVPITETILFEDGEHEGLPIGNYVSQYFANIYLNELD